VSAAASACPAVETVGPVSMQLAAESEGVSIMLGGAFVLIFGRWAKERSREALVAAVLLPVLLSLTPDLMLSPEQPCC